MDRLKRHGAFISVNFHRNANGRLARIIFAYFLGNVCPFWAPIYGSDTNTTRDHYLAAIVEARVAANPQGAWCLDARPELLARLALDNVHASWLTFWKHLRSDVLCLERPYFLVTSSQESSEANSPIEKAVGVASALETFSFQTGVFEASGDGGCSMEDEPMHSDS